MFGGVKITLILCLTIVVSCVLFISYNEYTNRYSLLTANDNSLYIFDKKSTVLNKCDGNSCVVVETKLPTKSNVNFDPGFQQSKLFDSNKLMPNETAENKQIVAKPAEEKTEQKEGLISLNGKKDKNKTEDEKQDASDKKDKEKKKESKKSDASDEDEFVE